MPLFQCFTNGDRTVLSEVAELTVLHMHAQGFMANSDPFEAENWCAAKARLFGQVSELQQRLAKAPTTEAAAKIAHSEYDVWNFQPRTTEEV